MAIMVDPKGKFDGENKVWDALKNNLPQNVVVYFNRQVNSRQYDFCLLVENKGIVIIEVKGWQPENVLYKDSQNILVGDQLLPSPFNQARNYKFGMEGILKERFGSYPRITAMVCYPFMTVAQYKEAYLHMDSAENSTILKEDLEDPSKLQNKIYSFFDSFGYVCAEFDKKYLYMLRKEWEPDFKPGVESQVVEDKPYSKLFVMPHAVDTPVLQDIVNSYQNGVKIIAFFGEATTYNNFVGILNKHLSEANIEPDGNNLKLGYCEGFPVEKNRVSGFNLNVYLINNMSFICDDEFIVTEGVVETSQKDLLAKLAKESGFNLEQYYVEHAPTDYNTLVQAGAGTGKTFSMVSRVAFLCNKMNDNVKDIAEEIAMVTFTNDAANNMKVRIKQMFMNYFVLTGDKMYLNYIVDVDRAHISTIHSFAIEILRKNAIYAGVGAKFVISSDELLRGRIYDEHLNSFIKEKSDEDENFSYAMPVFIYDLKKKLMGIADKLLAKSVDLNEIKSSELGAQVYNTIPFFNEMIERVVFAAEKEYSQSLKESNRVDLKECLVVLERVLKSTSEKFRFLKTRFMFIDEFQDTDDSQIAIFQKLIDRIDADCKLFVVGDLKQSIYRFRGATLSAFEQLKKLINTGWKEYYLNTNYRTDKRLLDMYDIVFAKMGQDGYLPYNKPADQLCGVKEFPGIEGDLLLEVVASGTDEDGFFGKIIDVIKECKKELEATLDEEALKKKPDRLIALLVRNNWQIEKIVKAGKEKGINIITKSGGDLYQLESTLDLYKLVMALNSPGNVLYLVNFIESNYTNLKLDYYKYHNMLEEDKLKDLQRVLNEFFMLRMNRTWDDVVNDVYDKPILFVLRNIYNALAPWKQYSSHEGLQKHYMANYDYLIEKIIKFARVEELSLNQVCEHLKINITTKQKELSRDTDIQNTGVNVICTTVHKSKGLEYGTVIVPYTSDDVSDMRSNKLDANYSGSKLSYTVTFKDSDITITEQNSYYDDHVEQEEKIAEEARILYVALTRAIRKCVWIRNDNSKALISWKTMLEV